MQRRDFLNGLALAAGAGSLSPLELFAAAGRTPATASPYPPALTGLRGSQPGSFEVAHALAREGVRYPRPKRETDSLYDLVVVGGGISGLAAAFFWRQKHGPDAKILILDNHDDFGGHARRNEFSVDGQQLIGYGGSQSIDTPGNYSPVAAKLLRDLGIFTERFYGYYDQEYFAKRALGTGIWFSREAYGKDVTAPAIDTWRNPEGKLDSADVASYPIGSVARDALVELLNSDTNYLQDLTPEGRIAWLARHSYRDFLLTRANVPEDVYLLFRDQIRGLWGVGWDAVSALEAARMSMPGTRYLALPELPDGDAPERDEPYIFHFPDGNAGVARALVRALVPGAIPGESMEDLVLARADYAQLDKAGSACRIRLNSTAVDVRNTAATNRVDIVYRRGGNTGRVSAKHAVLACYNNIIPHLCPEMPAAQREALDYAEKIPLVYINIALRNWRPFAELGLQRVQIPRPELMHSFGMDFPVSMGGLQFPQNPDQPAIIHGSFIPCAPDQGLEPREQHRRGRHEVYATSYSTYEAGVFRQLEGALGNAGLDVERDIAGLTVNRWPHGYAYEYNSLFDPPKYGRDRGPHVLGAKAMGRISIANSDASAYAFVDGAIDAAWRAVREQDFGV